MELISTLNKYLNSLSFIQSCSAHTLRAYQIDLSQAFKLQSLLVKQIDLGKNSTENLLTFFKEDKKSIEINSDDELLKIARQAQTRWAKLSLASRNRKTACLKSFFNWLYEKQYSEKQLSLFLSSPKVMSKIPNFLSLDESLQVCRYLLNSKDTNNTTEKILFFLLYGAGLRISEACSLTFKDIHWQEAKIRIIGKGQKERYIPLPPISLQILKAHHLSSPTKYVWGDSALDTRAAYEKIRNLGRNAGLNRKLNPHALRHSYATHLLSSGSDLRILQELLGHANLQATQKYTHLNLSELSEKMQRLHPASKLKLNDEF